jgi:hypothetical protein
VHARWFQRSLFVAAVFGAGSAAAVVGLTPGCLTCDSDVCQSVLSVTVHEPGHRALTPGVWTFEVAVDGAELLLATCDVAGDSRAVSCDGDLGIGAIIVDDPDNPYTRFSFGFGDEIGNGIEDLPESLVITILVGDDVVLEERFEPEYELSKPKRCDPDCFDDAIDIVVDPSG